MKTFIKLLLIVIVLVLVVFNLVAAALGPTGMDFKCPY
jgi:hypothetical protein